MKKLLVCLVLLAAPFTGYIVDHQPVQAEQPYEKWGKLAVSKTQEKYPNAKVKDYKHLGRIQGTNTTIEKFKLVLTEKEKEFGLIVHIEFDKETEKIIDVTFKEVAA